MIHIFSKKTPSGKIKFLRTLLIFELLITLTLGNFSPVLAEEIFEATISAIAQIVEPQIPNLPLPFSEDYPVGLYFGQPYPEDIPEEILSKLEKLGGRFHSGIDFEIPEGIPVISIDDGIVTEAGEGDFGITVVVSHKWGTSVYGHLKEVKVQKDQSISKGSEIGLSGNSGITTGFHLHFGIKPFKSDLDNGFFGFVDPAPYLGISKDSPPIEGTASAALQEKILGAEDNIPEPTAIDYSTDDSYLYDYKFNLRQGSAAHLINKKRQDPSFAITDQNYDSKLRFFLKDSRKIADATVNGNLVEYRQSVLDIPMLIRYTIRNDQVKEELILQEKPSSEIFISQGDNLDISFLVETENLLVEQSGEEYYFRAKDGSVTWILKGPNLKDREGREGSISGKLQDNLYILSIDSKFLQEAVYPVTIDPTIVIGEGGDTTCSEASIENKNSDVSSSHNFKKECEKMLFESNDKAEKNAGFKIKQKERNKELLFTLKNSKNSNGTASGKKLTYKNIDISGIKLDLEYEVTEDKVKEKFIIDKKPNKPTLDSIPASVDFVFDFVGNGLNRSNNNDEVEFRDQESSDLLFTIPKLTYDDAAGSSGNISLSFDDANQTATISIDSNFLKTATYPVVIDPTVIIGSSSLTGATQPLNMRHLVRTSEASLHSFIQFGTQTGTCGSGGLWWLYSTDSGSNWTCGGQLSSDTNFYADAKTDTSDNIYVAYSYPQRTGATGSTSYDVYYRKLTKGAGSAWTLENQQTVLDSTSTSTSYSSVSLDLEGTTRIWLAVRYSDGTLAHVSVYYSDGLTASPTWTVSQSSLASVTPDSGFSTHRPQVVRFGSKIGVVYDNQVVQNVRFRYRNDGDSLTSWAQEIIAVNASTCSGPGQAVGDTNGNLYFSVKCTSLYFSYFNGETVSPTVSIASDNVTSQSMATDGTNIWIFYIGRSELSSRFSNHKLVYKKGSPPFTASDFDTTATTVVSYHGVFDKYWSYVSSAYTDDTTDAGNTTTADTQMVTNSGDIIYFGKSEKFDAVSWDVSTNGAGGTITWEYCSAVDATPTCTSWSTLSFTASASTNFTADGWGAFTSPADWQAAKVNSEGTAYYYIRARATVNYTTSPVGVQMAAIPDTYNPSVTATVAANTTHVIWTENASSPTRVRYASVTTTASTSPSSTAEISPVVAGYSSTTAATQPSTMRHIVRTSDGTLHAFVQAGTQLACGGAGGSNNSPGLNWIYSTDSGSTWTCGGQLSSDTTNLMYADARVDSSDNIYVVYSMATTTGGTAKDVFYRKLTKGAGATWTLESAQTVLDGTSTVGYHYATIELQGTTRLWLATRYYDGTNYQVSVYYSDGLTASPTWTQSVGTLDTAGTNAGYHYPTIVRFGTKIGILYLDQTVPGVSWRFRADADGFTSWSAPNLVDANSASITAIGDANGRIFWGNCGTSIFFRYFNGTAWSSRISVTTTASGACVSISTDGTNAWVFYGETSGLSGSLSGSRKLVYKKGVPPFTASDFDATSTSVVSYHGIFDKYWSYVSSVYTDDTTDAGNTTTADTQMLTGVGDIAYFGKTAKFDAVSWDVSTSGDSGGRIAWEYWNGSSWMQLIDFHGVSNSMFTGDGYISFIPPSDWTTTQINGEGTAYYYIRARVTTAYSTSPVGVQMAAIPAIYWASAIPNPVSNTINFIWTENAGNPTRVRYSSASVTSSTAPSSTVEISPKVMAYSSSNAATQPSTMRHLVRTSDGTLHAFVQAGTQLACGGSTGSNNNPGLNWIYSTDSGVTWTCGGQLSSDTSNLMYADARVDSSDNIYVVYSMATTTGGTAKDVFYRKLTKGVGATWTLESAQTVLDGTSTVGYHYATVELQGTTRLWLATRYYDGTNYQVSVYYSDGLTASPTWTQSVGTLDTAGTNAGYHYPTIVRFTSYIGIIYNDQVTSGDMKWRYRTDSDGLTSWNTEATITTVTAINTSVFSVIADTSGNIYLTVGDGVNRYFTYYNGSSWSSAVNISSAGSSFSSVVTDGTNVWLFYGETTGLSSGLSGSRKLVYKKGVPPFTASDFDATATLVNSNHTVFDKYWSYVSSAYTDDTADAGNTTSADTQMVTGVGDIAYFGKTAKFDAISWDVSTSGDSGGRIAWEYWNGSSWMQLIDFHGVSNSMFTGDGYISFIPPSDWTTTQINGEGTAYYYVRARVTTAYSTSPVGVQMAAIPQINWGSLAASTAGVYAVWTENASAPTRVRYSTVLVHNTEPSAPSSLGSSSLIDGSFGSDNTPSLTFTLSDPDASDTVKYQIQIDDSSDFGSAVVDYTSALAAQGSTSFTVGQAAGSGTYTTGSAEQTLSDGSYYWRVKAIDDDSAESSYSTANSGNIAFKIDTTAPSTPGTPSTTSPTNDSTPTWSWTASSDSGSGLATNAYSVQWCTNSSFTGCGSNTSTSTTNSFTHAAGLADGTWYFKVKAIDAVANESSYSGNGSVVIDATNPSVSLTVISPDPTTDSTPVVSGTTTDTGGTISTVQHQVDSTSGSWTTCTATDETFDEASETFNCQMTTLLDGSHTVYVRTTDNASNTSSNASDTFTIDTTAPASIELLAPGDNSYTNEIRPFFSWKKTTDATAGIADYDLDVDDGKVTQFSIVDIPPDYASSGCTGDTDSTRTCVKDKYTVIYESEQDSDSTNDLIKVQLTSSSNWAYEDNDGKLKEGIRTWKVNANDTAGNQIQARRTLNVDLSSPQFEYIRINDVSADSLSTSDKTPRIEGKVIDNEAGDPKVTSKVSKAEVKIEKENIFGLFEVLTIYNVTLSEGIFSLDLKELEEGVYRVSSSSSDGAGNTVSKAISLLVTITSKLLTPDEIEELQKSGEEVDLEITKPEQGFRQTRFPNFLARTFPRIAKIFSDIYWKGVDGIKYLAHAGGQLLAGLWREAFEAGKFAYDLQIKSYWWMYQSLAYVGGKIYNAEMLIARKSGETVAFIVRTAMRTTTNVIAFVNQKTGQGLAFLSSVAANGSDRVSQASLVLAQAISKPVKNATLRLTSSLRVNFIAMTSSLSQGYHLASSIQGVIGDGLTALGRGISSTTKRVQLALNIIERITSVISDSIGDLYEQSLATAQRGKQSLAESIFGRFRVKPGMTMVVDKTSRFTRRITDGVSNTVGALVRTAISTIASATNQTSRTTQRVKDGAVSTVRDLARTTEEGIANKVNPIANSISRFSVRQKAKLLATTEIWFDREQTKIVEVKVVEVGRDYAVIYWRTNHHTKNNKVNYGEDRSYDYNKFSEDLSREHMVKLTDLKPDTTYYFEVMSQNKNYVYDAYYEFKTRNSD